MKIKFGNIYQYDNNNFINSVDIKKRNNKSNIHSNTQQTRERQWSLEKEKRIMDKLPPH